MAPRNRSNELQVAVFHSNTDQEVITITSDRLELALNRHLSCIADARAWQVPATLLVSLISLFCTTDFKAVFGLGPDVWRGFFYLILLGSVVWLGRSLIKLTNRSDVAKLIGEIKSGARPD